MSRRVLAPVLLLLAAAGSIAAVFAVHGIESRGGPLSQPSATRAFNPSSEDAARAKARISFTTQGTERVTVRIVDSRERVVRTLAREKQLDGEYELSWDGRDDDGEQVPDGEYVVRITRAGDDREYGPTGPVTVDTAAPIAMLDAVRVVDDQLRGLVLLEQDTRLVVETADGDALPGPSNQPHPNTPTLTPRSQWPEGTRLVRFAIPLDGTDLEDVRMHVVDAAGNRTDLLDDDARTRLGVTS